MELRLHFIDGSIIEKKEKLLELDYFQSNERFNKDKTNFNFTPEEFSCKDFIHIINSLDDRHSLHNIENENIIDYFGVPVNIIKLLDHQLDHVNFIENLLKVNNFYLDCSSMGCGKTFVSLYLAQKYKFKMIIICPKSMISSWKQLSEDYNIELLFITTYQSFRGTKHGYLSIDKDGNYSPTDKLIELSKNKILVVYDEIQYIKNPCKQLNACIALSKCILTNKDSKIGCLSATPFDKEELCVNLLYLTQTVKANEMYNYNKQTRTYTYTGYNELKEVCGLIDNNETKRITSSYIYTNVKKNILKKCYKLFINVLQPLFISSMKPFIIPFDHDCANLYCKLELVQNIKIRGYIKKLRCALKMLFDNKSNKAEVMSSITFYMQNIELIKVNSMIKRLVDEDIENNNCKIIIYVNYYKSINKLKEFYPNALQLSGNMSGKERDININKFNQHNMDYNILISNIKVGGIGINLHDINGNFPRKMYIIPSYSILDLHQATGRIYRAGTMSNSTVRIIYSKNNEKRLLEILAKKGNVLKDITKNKNQLNICSDYRNIIEN